MIRLDSLGKLSDLNVRGTEVRILDRSRVSHVADKVALTSVARQYLLYRLDWGWEPMGGVSRGKDDVAGPRLAYYVDEGVNIEIAYGFRELANPRN